MAPSSSPLPGRLVILYASQTGNAIDAAERVGREAEHGGCPAVDVLSMDSFNPSCLPDERFMIFIVSTTGQGDPPDSMKNFWKYLLRNHLGARWLKGLHYAMFGLGDSSYREYNVGFPAIKLDQRLFDLGAKRITERGLGDDQHSLGYEGELDPSLLSLWKSLNRTNPSLLPRVSDASHRKLNILGDAKVEVIYYSARQATDISDSKILIEKARSMSPALKCHNSREPQHMLQMVTNQRLTKGDTDRDVRHFELEDRRSAISYQVGDVLEILPSQNPSLVDDFIKRCNLDPDCYITVRTKDGDKVPKDPIKLKTFVALTMDVTSASPRRYFFEVMSYFATDEREKAKLQDYTSPEGRGDLSWYNQNENRTVLEVLVDFPSVQMPFEWLVQLTPPLKKRAFSISSSPLVYPNQIHLTVSGVSWLTPWKRTQHGLCSTWLTGLSPDEDDHLIPCWMRRGSLPRPRPSVPLLLIGPGTGCAPFRAFVEERAAQSAADPTTAPVMFFFGCRNEDIDFLYKDFWLKHAQGQGGVLSHEKCGGFFAAFSRDQPRKVYVQDKIKEQGARVLDMLCSKSSKAAIYVAGSSTGMPADVTVALEEVLCQEGGVPREDASGWLKDLKRAGRFIVETWS
ncbi:NADPH-dependent diflavin oxidoreductase 1 [Triticum aestivum]|uniref:NADPH-dependent diflavin oxidoreductase 1 n=1 Tax=Triticum aestivum TaxID=4565 RepID=UPI001D02873E|nr:NADPH-dependent diflavin oxidoreductase 1-like [Triticum aestivum]